MRHPYPDGTRVRHDGRRWSRDAFATVVRSEPRGDTFEYLVAVDADCGWPTAGEETWWASYHTAAVPDVTGLTIGDRLDVLFGGPEHYTSHHCETGLCRACLGYYGGRTCEHSCHFPPVEPETGLYALQSGPGRFLAASVTRPDPQAETTTWTEDPREALTFPTPAGALTFAAEHGVTVELVEFEVSP